MTWTLCYSVTRLVLRPTACSLLNTDVSWPSSVQ